MVSNARTWKQTAVARESMADAAPVSLAAAGSAVKRPQWRLHDRTHLELATRFPLASRSENVRYVRETYFFIPTSLRVNRETYLQSTMESDFQCYVRLSAPRTTLEALATTVFDELRAVLDKGSREEQITQLRLYACTVRRAGLKWLREVRRVEKTDPARAWRRAAQMLPRIEGIAVALVEAAPLESRNNELQAAALWVCEDVTLFAEQLLGRLSTRIAKNEHQEIHAEVVAAAVRLAKLRASIGSDAVGGSNLDARMVEHLEFRRNSLKRFTSSILWLETRPHEPGRWLKHALYAVAAGVAMTFAVVAALWNGPLNGDGGLSALWVGVAIFAYAVKDRLKAALQSAFSGVLRKRYPHRRWLLETPQHRTSGRARRLGSIDEETEFVDKLKVPGDVLKIRRNTRRTMVEEEARPESILHHTKELIFDPAALRQDHPSCNSFLEVFRLDLRHWLVHTDDPKNRIVFANAEKERIETAKAPRVYNIAVIYRVTGPETETPWHRARIVVGRKGIRRIEDIC